ncbi:hypothetical protein H7B90_12095 [Cohnella xylanilytica]|uniref:Uncharacterized protein n=1 Tax=Cohnella xylanilytica TaxID=557555 RepID=A0A841U1A5_9BACL|nr:hypothetical protein [Cohnella xylanilytica]MBB6692143.1 hypothetical protein [Cohnella xylanilytica]
MAMSPSGLIWGADSTPELVFALIASILMGISSIVLFLAQAKQTGIFGFVSGVLLTIGNIGLAATFYGIFAYGDYPQDGTFVNTANAVSNGGMLLGTIILLVVTFRAKVFPRWYAAVFLLQLVSLGLPFLGDYFAAIWGLTYVLMGYSIFAGKTRRLDSDTSEQPSLAS